MKNSTIMPMTRSGSKPEQSTNLVSKRYNELLAEFKKNQMGYAAIAIIGQSCLGSVAVMLLLMNEISVGIKMGLVFLVTVFCMSFNGAVLAQLKSNITFNLLVLSVVFSCIVIIAHLI